MPPIIPISRHFDQSTLSKMIDADSVVQRYRARFALFDWSSIDPPRRRGPGRPAHPTSAYLKAMLVRINEHHLSTPRWRAYLLDHPLLVLELGFRPHLDFTQPYGFDVTKTVPSVRHLNSMLNTLDPLLLADLFAQSPSIAMSCWPIIRCPSTKGMSPTLRRCTSRPWPCSMLFPSTSRLMPPMTPGTSTRAVRLAVVSPQSPSTSMRIRCMNATLMASRCV